MLSCGFRFRRFLQFATGRGRPVVPSTPDARDPIWPTPLLRSSIPQHNGYLRSPRSQQQVDEFFRGTVFLARPVIGAYLLELVQPIQLSTKFPRLPDSLPAACSRTASYATASCRGPLGLGWLPGVLSTRRFLSSIPHRGSMYCVGLSSGEGSRSVWGRSSTE